jgi:uncharacterized protein YnzC (UPF0291/DUF896 family)
MVLNQDYVYAKVVTQQGTEVINSLYKIGPETLLTAVEIYKVRVLMKMYIKNLKLYLHQTPIST